MPLAQPERLRDGRDIVAVLRGKRHRAGHLAVLHARSVRSDTAVRVAVVASRRVGGAVQRNRAKRLLREAARRVAWRPGVDVVLVARAAAAESRVTEVTDELRSLAARLEVSDPLAPASPGGEAG